MLRGKGIHKGWKARKDERGKERKLKVRKKLKAKGKQIEGKEKARGKEIEGMEKMKGERKLNKKTDFEFNDAVSQDQLRRILEEKEAVV